MRRCSRSRQDSCCASLTAHTHKASTSLSFSRDGTHILSASYDGLARVHGLKSGKLLKEFRGHTSYVNYAMYTPDGTQVRSQKDTGPFRW